MGDPSDPESAAVFDFLEERREDLEAGRRLPLAHYLARHPAHEQAIAREWLRAEGGPAGALPSAEAPSARDAGRVGPYRLQVELGRGGQGTVWRARDERLGRLVALKRIEGGLGSASRERRERFRREAELIARLDHPGLCRVLEVELEGEAPWIAMQHVEGESLATLLERARAAATGTRGAALALPLAPRTAEELRRVLAYFERAARALHAAHEAGVIHRDVKPGNLMVTPVGEPVVLDFGLARLEHAALGLTLPGEIFGTPAYMSPEQLAGAALPLDRRTDVYSLGVCLHEALSLRKPFEGPTHLVLAERVRTRPPPDPRETNPRLPAELATVLAVALEKDRARRYASALELAEDLRRVSAREPIRARPTPLGLRLARWTRRHPVLAVLIAVLSISLALSLWQGARERRALRFALGRHLAERSRALLAEDQAAALALGLEACALAPGHLTSSALFDALEACRIERVLDGGARRVTACALVGIEGRAPAGTERRAGLPGPPSSGEPARLALAGQEDGQVILWDLARGRALDSRLAHEGGVVDLAAAPAGRVPPFAWSVGADRSLRGWHLDGERLHDASFFRLADAPLAVAVDERGRRVAVLLADGRVVSYDIEVLGATEGEARVDPGSGALAFLAGGALVVGPGRAARPARALLWRGGEEPRALVPETVALVRPSPSRAEVLLACTDGVVRFRDARGGESRADLALGGPFTAAAWSPDGLRVALAVGPEGHARVQVFALDALGRGDASPGPALIADPHGGRAVVALAFSPDGRRLASASVDLTARVIELERGAELARVKSSYLPEELLWMPDGERILARYNAPVLQVLFPGERPDLYALEGHASAIVALDFAPDGRRLVSASADGTARLWRTPCDAPGTEIARLGRHTGPLGGARFSADGARVLTFGRDGLACVLDGESGALLVALEHEEPLARALDCGGGRVLTLASSGRLVLWEEGRELWRADPGDEDAVLSIDLDPSSDARALCGTRRGRVLALDLARGALAELRALETPVRELLVAPRPGQLVLSCGDGSLRFVPAGAGPDLHPPLLQFPPERLALDGARGLLLAIGGSRPGQALTLDLERHVPLRPSELQQADRLVDAALSEDGTLALTASLAGMLNAWEPASARPVLLRDAGVGPLGAVALGQSPSGWRIAAGGRDGSLRVLPVDPLPAARARKPRELRQWERAREERLALPLRWP